MSKSIEYQQSLEKMKKRDFTHSWISSSGFLFYLQVACIVAFLLGGCYMLYTKRYSKINAPVPESSLYTPKYK